MCGGGKEEASAEASNEVEVEVEVEVNEEEKGWKRSGSATMTAGDEKAAGGPEGGLTCEWRGVVGMGAVEVVERSRTLTATCDPGTIRSP